MYSLYKRSYNVVHSTVFILICLIFALFLSTSITDYSGTVALNTVKVVAKHTPPDGSDTNKILGFVTFDLKADLSHLFNWNVKWVYLYLTAEYSFSKKQQSQEILWDAYIIGKRFAKLNFNNMNTKYYFWYEGRETTGHKKIILTMRWNIIPNVGFLIHTAAPERHSFYFPLGATEDSKSISVRL